MKTSVSYHHRYGDRYSGSYEMDATITLDGVGEISSRRNFDGSFDPPVFRGRASVNRNGSWSHARGSRESDEDGHVDIHDTEDRNITIKFHANNGLSAPR